MFFFIHAQYLISYCFLNKKELQANDGSFHIDGELIVSVKGIVSRDFDVIFMVLSYSWDVWQLPLDILFFNFDVFTFTLLYIIFSA
jgi:hypothetical protein